MNVKNILILFAISIILMGCAEKAQNVKIQKVFVKKTPLELKDPETLKPKKIEWFVITPENAEKIFADIEKKKYTLVLVGLTTDGYENLAMNLAAIRKYMIEQKTIIKAYKQYYEED